MLTFLDGPAAGKADGLCIKRAPLFLRVVHDTAYASAVCKRDRQEWDALDQLADMPRLGEVVHVYRLVGSAGSIHVNSRDRRGRHNGGTFVMATYQYVEPQPDEGTCRSTALWRAWATKAAEVARA